MKQKYCIFILVLAVSILGITVPQAFAQNFADFGDDLSDEEDYFEQELPEQEKAADLEDKLPLYAPLDETELFQDISSRYTLGPTDIIEIVVMRHPEVSGEYIINMEGNIQYDFVGDLRIAGLTKGDVADLLVEHLGEYIISPEVTVKITGYNSKVVYVIGEVGRPGKIPMKGDSITVREALIQAGLPTMTAKSAKSTLITPSADAEPDAKPVDAYKLLYEGDLRENLVMKPGDTLYVPPTFMAKTMRVIQPITTPITTAAGAGRSIYTGGF